MQLSLFNSISFPVVSKQEIWMNGILLISWSLNMAVC